MGTLPERQETDENDADHTNADVIQMGKATQGEADPWQRERPQEPTACKGRLRQNPGSGWFGRRRERGQTAWTERSERRRQESNWAKGNVGANRILNCRLAHQGKSYSKREAAPEQGMRCKPEARLCVGGRMGPDIGRVETQCCCRNR